ncbi:MAG TPA: carbamoyltransferase HypF [Chloroflexia bacterium]|nr:carbamoyltransferase HypF [Chloroflexia bacterium]
MTRLATTRKERWRISVRGIVQGVGFRPFVYGQAQRLGLSGFVLNDSSGAIIEVEGEGASLEAFQRALLEEAPPLARIDSVSAESMPVQNGLAFVIAPSRAGAARDTLVSPDAATCADCIDDLLDPSNRRYRYPFTNCTNCGPRFTIVADVPYDRGNTTMRAFPMCPGCQAEYDDPLDRRFHAQPNACPVCGPRLRLLGLESPGSDAADEIAAAARHLANGAILAVKGLGGYHLACDAGNAGAVDRLRQRKHREARPFALMVPDLDTARQLCVLSGDEAALLQSPRRPIVLLNARPDSQHAVAPGVAPGLSTLGIMLPYTPLHHLLLRDFAAVIGPERPAVLVMTSGNMSDEPIAYRDDDARQRLSPIADGFLGHDREINTRCDDSVARIAAGGEQIFRRSRGYAPEPVPLPLECRVPILACGGHLKSTFALCKGRQAFVSHHIGDLENVETLTSFRTGITHYERLFDLHPQAVAYDLHPDYLATQYAMGLDIEHKIGVQHHHAHIASVLAEHGLEGPVIGVAADGTGYGTDGAVWGCEVMIADLAGFERRAHLAYAPLPGGEQAVRQPWRMGAVYLQQAFGDAFLELDIPFSRGLDSTRWRTLAQMAERGLNSPSASSLGRLFDAVSAILGVRGEAIYEGQAAIELEALAGVAATLHGGRPYPFAIIEGDPAVLDVAPLVRAIVEDIRKGVPAAQVAAMFHGSIAELLAASCLRVRSESGLNEVALSGGVFQNRLLLEKLTARLGGLEFRVYINRRVPPNDGGLSYGQAAVAAARLALVEGGGKGE